MRMKSATSKEREKTTGPSKQGNRGTRAGVSKRIVSSCLGPRGYVWTRNSEWKGHGSPWAARHSGSISLPIDYGCWEKCNILSYIRCPKKKLVKIS